MSMQEAASTAASPLEHNHADPWAKTFVDLHELNAGVTDAIQQAITTIRADSTRLDAELRTRSVLVLGPAGAGKTHLFARLRHKLGPKAIFVYLRPLVGTEMTPRYVLGQIVQQLAYESLSPNRSMKQLDALVGASLAQLDGESPEFPSIYLSEVRALDEKERAEKLEWAVEKLLERHQEADEMYLARLLEAPFMGTAKQRAALAWLSGRELEEPQMKRLGATNSLPDDRVMQALQTLGLFAAPGAPIVLVFDQLENLMDAEATGTRVRAYANLVAELFDATRGFVLVQMALDSEWEHAIRPQLSDSQKSRLGGHPLPISLPTPEQSRELIRRWTESLPDRAAPFPWPFVPERVEHWMQTIGLTPRMLMLECRHALALGPNAPFESPTESPGSSGGDTGVESENDDATLAEAWEEHLKRARAALDEASNDRRSADPARLVGGIACALRFDKSFQSVRVDARHAVQIVTRVGTDAATVTFLHQMHHSSIGTALERAGESLSRGRAVVLRERALEFPPTWKKVHSVLASLIKRGIRLIPLERDDSARLLALESFLASAKSKDLEDSRGRPIDYDRVSSWIERTLEVNSWPVTAALLGGGEPVEPPPSDKTIEPPPKGPASKRKVAGDVAATIRACLTQLGVASLDRIVREVTRVEPKANRTEVLATLEAMSADVRWFGRAIVALKSEREAAR